MIRIAILIDGGSLRTRTTQVGRLHNPDHIEKVALSCSLPDEQIVRILYYDCAPYNGDAKLPVSGATHTFYGSSAWLRELARRDLFAVRLGILKFRGFVPKNIPLGKSTLTDADFKPTFEQKGVDMRIGLDIAQYANARAVERIVLITEDTDCIPAMKHARKTGLQIALVHLPTTHLAPELREHCDFVRPIPWP